MEGKLLAWLDAKGITNTRDPNTGRSMYGMDPDGVTISTWRFSFDRPSADELLVVSDIDVKHSKMTRKIRDGAMSPVEVFAIVKKLCDKLNIDVDTLTDDL